MDPQVSGRPRRLLLLPSSPSTMILYLLLAALILDGVDSQTANLTEEVFGKAEGNQTHSEFTSNNSTTQPDNVTSSLYKDEKSLIEDELQTNQTSSVFTEDNENFQDQEKEYPGRHCHQDQLVKFSHSFCGQGFHKEMLLISPENWCELKNIIGPYNDLSTCLESLSEMVGCYYPNPNIQDFFLHIHSYYFKNCSKKEGQLVDAPRGLVIALTVLPVSLIPVLVYLVVWKSKVQE